jgi:cobalamin-dependent methionine synthase I
MIIVGELINASRKAVGEAISAQNAEAIKKLAVDQHEAGANYIDVNAGIFVGQEAGYLQWLVKTVQGAVNAPCCIDSPDPKAIENALSVHKGTAMINSISLEKDRYNALLPVVAGTDLKVVALCMSDEGMPETTEDRVKIADQLINDLVKNNIPLDNIYVDPLVQPVSTKSTFGDEFLNAVDEIMTRFKGVHTICGLSNISYGLPLRQMLNQTFAVMAIARGLDALIINPLDSKMIQNLIAAETLAGRDDYCMNYLKAYRKKKFE